MEYLTVRETARKWNLSDRMVQQFFGGIYVIYTFTCTYGIQPS